MNRSKCVEGVAHSIRTARGSESKVARAHGLVAYLGWIRYRYGGEFRHKASFWSKRGRLLARNSRAWFDGIRDRAFDLELRVFSLQRSGHHAVCNWLMGCLGETSAFSNNVVGVIPHGPWFEKVFLSSLSIFHENRLFVWNDECLDDREFPARLSLHLPDEMPHEKLALRRLPMRLRGFLWNAESVDLERAVAEFPAVVPPIRAKASLNVLVLRDPFNTFASQCRMDRDTGFPPGAHFSLWKQYAREFAGETDHLGRSKVCVSFNEWSQSADYRARIARQICGAFDDVAFAWRSRQGSSFGPNGDHSSLSNRWQVFQNDPLFRATMADQELRGLAGRIFGHPPDEAASAAPRAEPEH